jgi:hypothetical protein
MGAIAPAAGQSHGHAASMFRSAFSSASSAVNDQATLTSTYDDANEHQAM